MLAALGGGKVGLCRLLGNIPETHPKMSTLKTVPEYAAGEMQPYAGTCDATFD